MKVQERFLNSTVSVASFYNYETIDVIIQVFDMKQGNKIAVISTIKTKQ